MEDREIIELYFSRDERAIGETQKKYSDGCLALANRILNSAEDSSEAVNDTFLKAWNTIPPQKPEKLFPYLAMLCRRISIDRLKGETAKKRGGGEFQLSIEELEECIPDTLRETDTDLFVLRDSINAFLEGLPEKKRVIFMRRYWWVNSISQISEEFGMSESSVKMTLLRLREKLRKHLEKEGFTI